MKNMMHSSKRIAFHETLRKSGYKATPPRLAILGIFNANKNPMCAQEIIEELGHSKKSGIDQATVYRTIKSLKASGIIRQIDLRHNHAHYELAGNSEHHHLICLRCGRIEDVPHREGEVIENAILRNSKHFAEIRQHTLELYGVCKACAKKNEAAQIEIHKNAPL